MSAPSESSRKAVPAQLGFLAIYNPSLGTTDETVADQIVYYTSPEHQERRKRRRKAETQKNDDAAREESNQQLRRIGLAQGMVEFGRSFSDGKSIDTIETEKSRIVLHELESGWWILASINLTILPRTVKAPATTGKGSEEVETTEYSSREVKPAILLLGDLLRAHSTFLLHHASSMSALSVCTKRSKFIDLLGRYWDTFLSTWNVLMHGNPANSLYGGIKIAACGELGVGVGEEDRGSGEREVLEGFVDRIEGLVDVIVSRFGDAEPRGENQNEVGKPDDKQESIENPWLGSGDEPAAEDGAIFLGTGALSRKSLRDVSHWIEDIYRWGSYAYGVMDNPTENRHQKKTHLNQRKKKKPAADLKDPSAQAANQDTLEEDPMAIIPPMPINETDRSLDTSKLKKRQPSFHRDASSIASTDSESRKGNKFMSYLKLGYGTHWSLGTSNATKLGIEISTADSNNSHPAAESVGKQIDAAGGGDAIKPDAPPGFQNENDGHFLIGLIGNLEDYDDESLAENVTEFRKGSVSSEDYNARVVLRTLTVELERAEDARPEGEISIDLSTTESEQVSPKHTSSERTGTSNLSFESQDRNKAKKLRVVVYVNRPFVFVFLFELRSDALAWTDLYQSLHYQIGPLHKPLLSSTTFRASKHDFQTTSKESASAPIYDLVWDPQLLTVHSTVPNIPNPYSQQSHLSAQYPWSRIEALNTHMQIINTYISISKESSETERTCKTSRGWWVVWTRIPDQRESTQALASGLVKVPGLIAEDSAESNRSKDFLTPSRATTNNSSTISGPAHPFLKTPSSPRDLVSKDKEIFLIRRASDYKPATTASRFVSGSSITGESGWAMGPAKLAQGIGVDTKRYIEGLLNLNR
ncbi:hypothetical protein G7Y89_g7073 [Cudoniella acicularis]|uniref:CCZ1/INTU/HSP4 first Longin domain-containing protein n=1 Tax=Cudoniella acicularis TaxID=354080 RepID=A0A8H4W1V8_9HELO|nr:hypothetical protein G7Y89_g7073 [Cudoniella acicularis]